MGQAGIAPSDVDFHPSSFCDRRGRVFWWKGGLYRGISTPFAAFYRSLFERGVVRSLVERQILVGTDLTDLTLPGYPLVLQHDILPFVSYSYEWCFDMLQDAALFLAEVETDLIGQGLTLTDAAPYNLLFDGCRPVLVDFCSLDSIEEYANRPWRGYDDFHSFFVRPLRLMASGSGHLARWLMHDYEHGAIQTELATLLRDGERATSPAGVVRSLVSASRRAVPRSARPLVKKVLRLDSRSGSKPCTGQPEINRVRRVQEALASIRITPSDGDQPVTQQETESSLNSSAGWTPMQHAVCRVVTELRPATLLDLGCGNGWCSRWAARAGSRVLAVDVDERSVARCYRQTKGQGSSVLPLVLDIRYPSPGLGVCNQVLAPALQRLRCDMVLALSLAHLLVFEQHLVFAQVAETLAAFSRRWALVEFVSLGDAEVSAWRGRAAAWYGADQFVHALRKWFGDVRTVPTECRTRVLFLCEKPVEQRP